MARPSPQPDRAAVIRQEIDAERARRCVQAGTLATAWWRRQREAKPFIVHRFAADLARQCDRWVDAFVAGRSLKLSLHAPPGHGKTEMVGRTMLIRAMALAPGQSLLYVTSVDTRAVSVSRAVRAACERLAACGAYPHLAPHPEGPWTDTEWRTVGGNYFTAIGARGQATGGVDANGIVFDDVTGSAATQKSEAKKTALWEFIEEDVLSRLRGMGPIANMETRRGIDDLTARLAKVHPDFEQHVWRHVAEDGEQDGRAAGEYLWPEKYGKEWHKANPQLVPGGRVWETLHQQRPTKRGGSIILEEWTSHRYSATAAAMARACHTVILAVDPAAKKGERNDPTGLVVMGRRRIGSEGSKTAILFAEAERRDSPASQRRIKDLISEWGEASGRKVIAAIEDTSAGQAWIPALRELGCTVVAIQVAGKGDKVVRMEPSLGEWAGGMVELPEDGPWVGMFVGELTGYTGEDGQPDNLWDATSAGLSYFASMQARTHSTASGILASLGAQ